MSARRNRLKAVINLPVRRGREDDQTATTSDITDVKISPSNATEQPVVPCKQDVATKEVGVTESSEHCKSFISVEPEEDQSTSNLPLENKEIDPPKAPITIKVDLPARKRIKPQVSLSAALSRKSKEIEKPPTVLPDKEDSDILQQTSSSVPISDGLILSNDDATLSVSHSTSSTKSPEQDISKLDSNDPDIAHTVLQSPPKSVTKSKFLKVTPRLVDPSARRTSHSYSSGEVESSPVKIASLSQSGTDNQKSLSSLVSSVSTALQFNSDSENELHKETSKLSHLSKNSSPVTKSTIRASVIASVQTTDKETLALDNCPTSKSEKRPLPHRRIRKNGPGETLSIARRDFYKKYGSGTPDKKKLTMFDLIFYNPITNPMKHDSKIQKTLDSTCKNTTTNTLDDISERVAEERVDDVATLEEADCVAMPAPQVKVGPDGSLIIDEQSLVIETTGSQKRKDEFANSTVIEDYGLSSATYSSFTKKVKSKEWTKIETLKFYRALHSVGTDFLLMQSIFPNRTRGDLKQKYKKEDRRNRELIDKALRNPLEFNLTELEKELEHEEKELQMEVIKTKQSRTTVVRKTTFKKTSKKKKSMLGAAVIAYDVKSPKPRKKSKVEEDPASRLPPKKRKVSSKCCKSSSSEDDEDHMSLDLNDDDGQQSADDGETVSVENKTDVDEEVTEDEDLETKFLKSIPQPTRYGRVPQFRKSVEEIVSYEEESEETTTTTTTCHTNECFSVTSGVPTQPMLNIPQLTNAEPGSLLIISTPGQKRLQFFMIPPNNEDKTHIPVAISPEILSTVSDSIREHKSQESTSGRSVMVEENRTIPYDGES